MVIFVTGQTFTLTTNIETVPATGVMTANSSITGVINGAGSTFQTGDIINGNATSNAAVTIAAANANTLVAINTLQGINFRTLTADAVNAQLFSNVATVATTGSNAVLSITNGDIASTYSVNSSVAADGLNVALRAGQIGGTSDTLRFNILGAGNPASTGGFVSALTAGTGIEAISVATAGSNSFSVTGGGAATDAATLTITGAGANTIALAGAGLAVTSNINASAATGALSLTLGASLTSNDTVSGGSGTADTLRATTAGIVATNLNISGFETLRLDSGANSTLTFATAPAVNTLRFDSGTAGLKTLANVGNFNTLLFRGPATTATAANAYIFNGVATTGSFAGTADTVTLTLDNGGVTNTNVVPYVIGALNITGAETITGTVADNTANSLVGISSIVSSTLQSLSLSGSVNVDGNGAGGRMVVDTATVNGNSLATINLSGLTGNAVSVVSIGNDTANILAPATTVTAGAGGLNLNLLQSEVATDVFTFTGGAGADTLTSNAAGTTFLGNILFSGGAGADTAVIGVTGVIAASFNGTGAAGVNLYDLTNINSVTINDFDGGDGLTLVADLGLAQTTTATIAVNSNFTAVASAGGGTLATNVVEIRDGGAGAGTVNATFNLGTAVTTFNLALAENGGGALAAVGATINGANTAAAATINGTNGADNITGSAFADTLRGNGGADVIVGGAGVDNFVFTTGITVDTITDFSVATNEIAQFSIAALNTTVTGLSAAAATFLSNGNSASIAAGNGVLFTAVAGATTLGAGSVLNITGASFAALANVDAALEAGGIRALTTNTNAMTANETMLIQWQDNAGLYHLSAAIFAGTDASTAVAVGGLNLADIAIVGTTALTNANFQFI